MSNRKFRVGALVAGINTYRTVVPGGGARDLQFAELDVQDFHGYLTRTWPGQQATFRCVLGADATLEAIRATMAELRGIGVYELFVLYFSGHGAYDADGHAWFLTADATTQMPGIDAGILDELLNSIRAEHVLLVLDCCYSEARS